ncbi:unnamed protein product [Moneuplotes crassus]|uniref:Uncharacterized protein n=1 Tax=Euplotes crassus TaxID=5936 RepID=A0AAD1Y566_EUPCR|nr:unnamed protein product [Moneuplotes crassus]
MRFVKLLLILLVTLFITSAFARPIFLNQDPESSIPKPNACIFFSKGVMTSSWSAFMSLIRLDFAEFRLDLHNARIYFSMALKDCLFPFRSALSSY